MDERDDLEMELDEPNDNDWDEDRFEKRMDKVSNASQNLGALLLQGWTMLADECKHCHTPLMSLRGAEPRCVMCKPVEAPSSNPQSNAPSNAPPSSIIISRPNKGLKGTSKREPTLTKVDELKESNPQRDRAFGQRIEKGRDASARIGELLLKGWTMLAQHCPKCQSPLMSLRGGNPMCCICDTPKQIVIQKQPPKEQDTARTVQRTMASNVTANGTKMDHPTGLFVHCSRDLNESTS